MKFGFSKATSRNMPSSLNTTFNALKDNMAHAAQEDQLRDPISNGKYTNEIGKEVASYSTLMNNHIPIFKEDLELDKTLQGWKSLLKSEEPHPMNSQYKIRKLKNVNGEDKELFNFSTPNYDNEVKPPLKCLLHKEPTHSKSTFSSSYKQESFGSDDFMHSPKISSSVVPNLSCAHNQMNMNFVMLIGLVVGLIFSKVLNYMEMFLMWLLKQVLQTRTYLMGTTSIWKFLNLDETNRLQISRSKLFLLPVIVLCCFIYNLIDILHLTVRLLLATVPNNLVQLVQNFHE